MPPTNAGRHEDTEPSTSAVVVGAGIGGLAAALALLSSGWQVRVLERAGRLDPVGAGITLWPNAVLALDALGVPIRDRASQPGTSGLRSSNGRWLSRADTSGYAERYGAPLVAVHRADLQRALLQALPDTVVATDTPVTGIHQDAWGATVEHSAGSTRAAVVVLADGLSSGTRHLVAGPGPRPRYAGYTAWRAVTDPGADLPRLQGTTESWGRGERFGIVPLADGRVYWFATANAPEGRTPVDGGLDEGPGEGEHAEVTRRFASWHEPVAQLVAATAPESVLRHDVYDLRPGPRTYVRGRLVLLGDAAHAMTPNLGQGACQALEDAVTLGALLRPGDEPEPTLVRYDALRRPRAQLLTSRSRQVGVVAQLEGRAVAAARDLLLRLTPSAAADRQLAATLRWTPPSTSG
jgi:2-polyprenyl-6-methoxyphenol hydroxylase-like FAD-dependent oxidoreductase